MSVVVPWLATFAFGVGVFLVGLYLQRKEQERSRTALRKPPAETH